jgi:hypothetical protein
MALFCALFPRFATTITTPWQTALKCTADCQPPALRPDTKDCGWWQSARKFKTPDFGYQQYGYFHCGNLRSTHDLRSAICQNRDENLSAEFSKRGKSSPRHFMPRDCLFEASYIFNRQLYKCKTDTRTNV